MPLGMEVGIVFDGYRPALPTDRGTAAPATHFSADVDLSIVAKRSPSSDELLVLLYYTIITRKNNHNLFHRRVRLSYKSQLKWATVATIDMDRKDGGLLYPFRERGWVPVHNVA